MYLTCCVPNFNIIANLYSLSGCLSLTLFFFDFILYVPVNNLSFMSGRVFLGWWMCLAQGHNAVTLGRLEPTALRSRVKHSTTEPLCFPESYSVRHPKDRSSRDKAQIKSYSQVILKEHHSQLHWGEHNIFPSDQMLAVSLFDNILYITMAIKALHIQ